MNYRYLALTLCFAAVLQAQPVLTPTPEAGGAEVAANFGGYKIVNSVETGYRFTRVGGEQSLFKSVENYGNGLRVFGGSFVIQSKDGHGRVFDSATFNTSGMGNDPYGFAGLTVEKKDRYRYDMTWRRNDYNNASLLNGEGATWKNTRRVMQDHDLSVQATPWAKLLMGYTRNHETGPEFTNYETYIGGLARSGLPLSRDTRRDFHEYRLGGEFRFLGFRLAVTHRWEDYKDDSAIASLFPGQPYAADLFRARPFDPTLEATYPQAATAYSRNQPMHTGRRGWFGNLSRNEKYWATSASVAYSKGETDSVYSEKERGAAQAAGTNIPTGDGRFLTGSNSGFGATIDAATYMPGTARQPFLSGDFSFSVFPTAKLTMTATASVLSNRYDGTGNELRVLSNSTAVINRFWTYHLGTGRVSPAMDVNYRVTNWLGVHAEYRYTSRFIDNNLVRTGTTNSRDFNSVRNHLNMGTVGFRLKPVRALSVQLDSTTGRDNGPLTPVSAAHFHNLRGRVDYRVKKMKFGGTYRQVYNLNSPYAGLTLATQPLDYSTSHSRDVTGNASFQATRRLALDLNYSRTHMDSLANLWALLVPQGSTTINTVSTRGYSSQFVSNLQTVSVMARATVRRGTLYVGYHLSRDAGDGRGRQDLGLQNVAAAYTTAWSTFPMRYQSPMARLSIKLTPKTQWNFGWQMYRYHQDFGYFGYQPYYRAHTGYTSLTYTFGEAQSPAEPKSTSKEKTK